jgi:hypothetical protein
MAPILGPYAVLAISGIGTIRLWWLKLSIPRYIHGLAAIGAVAGTYLMSLTGNPWTDHPIRSLLTIVVLGAFPYGALGFFSAPPRERHATPRNGAT